MPGQPGEREPWAQSELFSGRLLGCGKSSSSFNVKLEQLELGLTTSWFEQLLLNLVQQRFFLVLVEFPWHKSMWKDRGRSGYFLPREPP